MGFMKKILFQKSPDQRVRYPRRLPHFSEDSIARIKTIVSGFVYCPEFGECVCVCVCVCGSRAGRMISIVFVS